MQWLVEIFTLKVYLTKTWNAQCKIFLFSNENISPSEWFLCLSLVKRQFSLSPLCTNIFPDSVYWKCLDHIYFSFKKILLVKGLYFRLHRIFFLSQVLEAKIQMYLSSIYVEEGCEISNKKTFKFVVKEEQIIRISCTHIS